MSKKRLLPAVFIVTMFFSLNLSGKIIERIVVKVNDEIITSYDITQKVKELRREKRRMPKNLRKYAQEQLINEKLVFQKAKKVGVMVTRLEVEDRILKMAASNSKTLEEFKKVLKKEGYKYKDFYDKIRKQIIMQKLFRKEGTSNKRKYSMKATEKEINDFYKKSKLKEYHVMHLYIRLSPNASFSVREKTENKIKKAKAALKRSKWNFLKIAKRYATSWKDYGFIIPSPKTPRFLFPLFKNPYAGKLENFRIVNELPKYPGYHAVFLKKIRQMPLSKVRNRIVSMLRQKKMVDVLAIWVKTLRKSSSIQIIK